MKSLFVFPVLFLLSVSSAAEQRRIYIACDDHTDYMWSGDEEQYRQAFVEMLDYYLDLADATASDPPEYQSRFACDGSLWLKIYQENRTPEQFLRLLSRITSGHISAPMTHAVSCYGGMPTEAVLRGMYYAGMLERQYGLIFEMAVSMENQGLPWGLASLWAGSGAKYSWRGVCNCRTEVPDPGDREHDIYYWTGPDGQRLLIKWNSMKLDRNHMGGYAEAYDPPSIVEYVTSDPFFLARYPYSVIGAFGHGSDNLKTFTDRFVTQASRLSNAARQVIVSNELDFFKEFESRYSAALPSVACSFGNDWDVLSTSMAEVTGGVRRSVEKLRSAEAMATVLTVLDQAFAATRKADRERTWHNLGLYWEHDWTADGDIHWTARAAWQRKLAAEIAAYVDGLYDDGVAAMGAAIANPAAANRFFVFNPLGWPRTDYADFDWSGGDSVHVVEVAGGTEVPSEIVSLDGATKLRIWAENIPALGYKVYEIRQGAGQLFADGPTAADDQLENARYQVTVGSGGEITSLVDKTRNGGREFAAQVAGRWINDLGGSGGGDIFVESEGPVSATIRVESGSPLAHTTWVTLYRGGERVDIRNHLAQNFDDIRSYVYSFDLDAPRTHHEEIGAIALADYQSNGGHYADRNTNYEWLSMNHFVDMAGRQDGVTLSNADCSFFRLGDSTVSDLDTGTPQIEALIGGQIGGLGIPAQDGDESFLQRFALRTHGGYDPAAAMRFSLEHQNPLVCGTVTATRPQLSETAYSLLEVSNPEVLLWSVKPAEEIGAGLMVRLWNLSASEQAASVSLVQPAVLTAAKVSTHIETDMFDAVVASGAIVPAFAPQQIRSFRLLPPGHHAPQPPPPPSSNGSQPGGNDPNAQHGGGAVKLTQSPLSPAGCGAGAAQTAAATMIGLGLLWFGQQRRSRRETM